MSSAGPGRRPGGMCLAADPPAPASAAHSRRARVGHVDRPAGARPVSPGRAAATHHPPRGGLGDHCERTTGWSQLNPRWSYPHKSAWHFAGPANQIIPAVLQYLGLRGAHGWTGSPLSPTHWSSAPRSDSDGGETPAAHARRRPDDDAPAAEAAAGPRGGVAARRIARRIARRAPRIRRVRGSRGPARRAPVAARCVDRTGRGEARGTAARCVRAAPAGSAGSGARQPRPRRLPRAAEPRTVQQQPAAVRWPAAQRRPGTLARARGRGGARQAGAGAGRGGGARPARCRDTRGCVPGVHSAPPVGWTRRRSALAGSAGFDAQRVIRRSAARRGRAGQAGVCAAGPRANARPG